MNPFYSFQIIFCVISMFYIVFTIKPKQKINQRFRELGFKNWGVITVLAISFSILITVIFQKPK